MWNNYAPDGNSIKRQLPKIDSRDKGMGFGNARKGEEMGVREGQVESGEQMRHTSATHRFLQGSLRNSKLSTTLLYRMIYGVYILVVVGLCKTSDKTIKISV
ncbi:hypothetical protein VN97_g6654 [Penicillium thymicola]|uniref:Uncharacterized protein n=1 Tax=Penicillium thymicola TaxID=293382 RepID=A0AAI9X7F3_PENTH|nr:hypothetical protein VN97_g6654 [Penicillium thymicola]